MLEPNSSAIVMAIAWLEGILVGSAATALATIAIAGIGVLLLTGRIDLQHGVRIVLGCFIVFGSTSIAHGFMDAVRGSVSVTWEAAAAPPLPAMATAPLPTQPLVVPYDPYAGAALPSN